MRSDENYLKILSQIFYALLYLSKVVLTFWDFLTNRTKNKLLAKLRQKFVLMVHLYGVKQVILA